MQIRNKKSGQLRRPLAFWLLWSTIAVAIWTACAFVMLRIAGDSVLYLATPSEVFVRAIIACLVVAMAAPAVVYYLMYALWEKNR